MNQAHDLSSEIWAKVYSKKKDVVTRSIAGDTFLVPIKNNVADMQGIFMMNPVAEYIWGQMDGIRNLGEVLDGIVRRFDVGKDEACRDIKEFVKELLDADLIEGGDCQ